MDMIGCDWYPSSPVPMVFVFTGQMSLGWHWDHVAARFRVKAALPLVQPLRQHMEIRPNHWPPVVTLSLIYLAFSRCSRLGMAINPISLAVSCCLWMSTLKWVQRRIGYVLRFVALWRKALSMDWNVLSL